MVDLEVDTSLEIVLSALFDEEQACESPEHFERPDGHAGAAQWYIHVKHEACGHDVVTAYCEKFKRLITLPTTIAACIVCGVELYASEVVQSVTRIGAEDGTRGTAGDGDRGD
jgi:hypothetical protein